MAMIGLIAAMGQERDALLRCSGPWEKASFGTMYGYQMNISGDRLFMVTSGMGLKRAAEAARMMVEAAGPQCLVSFGIAGSVEESLEIGDVILIEEVYVLENGLPGQKLPLQRWGLAGCEKVEHWLAQRGARLYPGTAVTTDGSSAAEGKLGDLIHPVLEMETMGIAQVAAERGIPFLAVRSISDGPKAPIPFDLGKMMDENANLRIGKLLATIIRHPRMLGGLGKMMRNSRIAEENAAFALIELISNHGTYAG